MWDVFIRVLLCFVFVSVFAEAPRPRPGFEGLNVRLTSISASGEGKAQDRSVGFEVTGNFPITQVGSWNYDWGFRYAQVRHEWQDAPVDFDLVRGVSLSLSGFAAAEGTRTRYAVLQVNADAESHAALGDGMTVQALYGADWKLSESFTVGYLFLAETRMVRSAMVLVVPTFRWKFAPDWTLGTARKSLFVERKLNEEWKSLLSLAFLQEEAHLANLGGQRQDYESERVAGVLSFRHITTGRLDEISLGWAFSAKARRDLGGVQTEYDLEPGAIASVSSRWKF